MSVKFDTIGGLDECDCVNGRSDLAFINYGYQMDTLANESTPAEDLGSLVDIDGIRNSELTPPSLKGQDVATMVESYLFNLYKALDDSHQAHETALRGSPSSLGASEHVFPDANQTYEDPSYGGVAPPFSAMSRAALGDPIATAQLGSSARKDLVRNFKSFGDDLRKTTKTKKLSGEISALNAKADRLKKRIAVADGAILSDRGVLVTRSAFSFGAAEDVDALKRELDQVQSSISDKEGELAMLANS